MVFETLLFITIGLLLCSFLCALYEEADASVFFACLFVICLILLGISSLNKYVGIDTTKARVESYIEVEGYKTKYFETVISHENKLHKLLLTTLNYTPQVGDSIYVHRSCAGTWYFDGIVTPSSTEMVNEF